VSDVITGQRRCSSMSSRRLVRVFLEIIVEEFHRECLEFSLNGSYNAILLSGKLFSRRELRAGTKDDNGSGLARGPLNRL